MDVDVTSYVTETQKNKKIQNTKITKVIGEKKKIRILTMAKHISQVFFCKV